MSSIKNTTNLYCLNAVQQKGLNLQLNKLDLHNRLMLTLNKKIENFPHNKVSDKLGGSLNQNIIFNFSNKNANTDRRSIKNLIITRPSLLNAFPAEEGKNAIKLLRSNVTDLGPAQVKNPARLGIINNVVNIITSFFKELGCFISRPQFIHKTDKLIVRIFYYQNNFNKNALFSNNKSNFIYNLFNGTNAAKAQYSAPKSQNSAAILSDMLGQTKWNKVAQIMFKNNDAINSLELANITKKVFILFIKDLMNITASNKELSIEKALTQLQKGVPALNPDSVNPSLGSGIGRFDRSKPARSYNLIQKGHGLVGFKKYNQLLIKLISSTNSESLTRKRTRLSKTFFNKSLLTKLTKKVNNHNNNMNFLMGSTKKNVPTKELIGKGLILNPINKKKLDALLAWSNVDLAADYKTIATALLVLIKNNKNHSSQGISQHPYWGAQIILANKINKILSSLLTQFADEVRKNINFIGKTTHPTSLKVLSAPSLSAEVAVNTKVTKLTKLTNSTLYPLSGDHGLKFIKLINKHFEPKGLPYLGQQGVGNSLTLAKEAFKAYNYGLNNNKNGITPSSIIGIADNVNKFKLLGSLLTKIFKKNIDLQIIKLHNVGLQENILAKVISENAKFDKSSVLIKKLLRKIAVSNASLIQFNKQNKILNNNDLVYNSNLHNTISVPVLNKLNINAPAFRSGVKHVKTISESKKNIRFNQLHDNNDNITSLQTNPLALGKVVGINIRIAGRLQKEAIKPKQTVKTVSIGSFSKNRANITSQSSFTSKNKKGTYRVTVKMAHSRTFSTF